MAEVDPGFASISSLMPQKRNSLVFEYVRARAAMVAGALSTVLGISHNTFFQDVEDVCIDVEPVIAGRSTQASRAVQLFDGVVGTMRFERDDARVARTGFSAVSALAEAIARGRALLPNLSPRRRPRDPAHARRGGGHELSGAEIDEPLKQSSDGRSGSRPEVSRVRSTPSPSCDTLGRRGASPDAVASMLEASTLLLERDHAAIGRAEKRLGDADRAAGRGSSGALSRQFQHGVDLDFDAKIRLDCRAGRIRFAEELSVDVVHRREVRQIAQVDTDAHGVRKGPAGRLRGRSEVGERLPNLLVE